MKRLCLGLVFLLPFNSFVSAEDLGQARSAFIRDHAGSPVHWMAWGEGVFERSREENKPVFLVIGTFSSELGRAMREQSFGHEENAALLNENFVCVLVDRDEFPGLAALNQVWVRSIKQLRGWPLNLWLTPELKPFEGANYLPPSDEWGNVGFVSMTKQVIAAWNADPDSLRRRAEADAASVESNESTSVGGALDAAELAELVGEFGADWMAVHDGETRGFGDPPRYPQPELLRFLLRSGIDSQKAAVATLHAMATGGVRDPLDGGFFRYARDAGWLFPNFQKSVADQARIALAYLDAARMTGDAFYGAIARGVLDFALTMKADGHGFIATEDGMSDSILPGFLWAAEEIRSIVGKPEADSFLRAYGATDDGNLPGDIYLGVDTTGKNVLHGFADPDGFLEARMRLLAHRDERAKPRRDSAATSGTHGLLLTAFARGGAELDEPRFVRAAAGLAGFVQDECVLPTGLLRAGPGIESEATARDYVLVLDGLLTYAETAGDASAAEWGRSLAEKTVARYGDPAAGRFFATPEAGGPGIWARVHLPQPDKTDLPGAETAFIDAWSRHGLGHTLELDIGPYVTGVVDAMEMDIERAKGDQLLALRVFLDASR
ncbi:MAG: DUF255 domain-containing protein [Opitutaceae bacterium]